MTTPADLIAEIVDDGYDVTFSSHRKGYYGQVWKEGTDSLTDVRYSKSTILCEIAETIPSVVVGLWRQWADRKNGKKPCADTHQPQS